MDDAVKTAQLLSKYEPGFLPYPIFEQVARLVALPIIEFIPLRLRNDVVEVLLLPRDASDRLWPGMVHTPGTVIRATDLPHDPKKNWLAFERIMHDELHDVEAGTPYYVGSMFHRSKRGVEQAQLYWIEVIGEPKIGAFYDVGQLPPNLIDSQREFIAQASKSYQQAKL